MTAKTVAAPSLGAGKEVLAYCSKCKLALAHIIVSMKGHDQIGKVECKTCRANHAFKDPHQKPKTRVAGIARKVQSKAEQNTTVWENAMKDANRKHHPYAISTKYSLGDIIAHPKFGVGVVDKMFDDNKIEVVFKQDVKTLIHNV